MLKQVLGDFMRLDGVMAAVVVGRDGFVIESAQTGSINIEAIGAMASAGMGASEALGSELFKGEMIQMLIELDSGSILLSPLSREELIAIIGTEHLNIGRIRYELKKNKERIVAAL